MRRRRSRSCNALQHTATQCNGNTLIWCADGCDAKSSWRCRRMPLFPREACVKFSASPSFNTLQRTATHTLQHTATQCNTLSVGLCLFVRPLAFAVSLQHIAHSTLHNTLQHTATLCNTLQHTATLCNTLQHTTTHCNTL